MIGGRGQGTLQLLYKDSPLQLDLVPVVSAKAAW
jgi:hypothetical protein